MFPGIDVVIGGRTLSVPGLSFTAKRRFSMDGTFDKADDGLRSAEDPTKAKPDHVDAFLRLGLSALQRNYPEMTDQKLGELLDLEADDGRAIGRLVVAVYKMTIRPRGEGEPKGEP